MRLLIAAAAGWVLLVTGTPGYGHRLDEYLQATLFSVERDRVEGQIRLTPGVAVFPIVFGIIDADRDGRISEAEQRPYAEQVLRDLSLTIDRAGLRLTLISVKFPEIAEMREGRGEIQLEFRAKVPPGGPSRRLIFKNHHESGMAAYLVNSLVPRDPEVRLKQQNRSEDQSVYQLDYEQDGAASGGFSCRGWSGEGVWMGCAALLLLARLAWLSRACGYGVRGRWRLRWP